MRSSNAPLKIFFVLLPCLLALAACSDTTVTPPSPPIPLPDSVWRYTLQTPSLLPLRTGEHYQLWLKLYGDSIWRSASNPKLYPSNGNNIHGAGQITIEQPLDSVARFLISVEQSNSPITPRSQLFTGSTRIFRTTPLGLPDSILAVLSANDEDGAGNYSQTGGVATFTTHSTDTTRVLHEFYLLNLNNGVPQASLVNLPIPRKNWEYQLWVTDSNFFPRHQFYYGSFRQSVGHDSDSLQDGYSFPGGFKPPKLNTPGGQIEVTLEPVEEGVHPASYGPSPFPILMGGLPQYIYANQADTLLNVTSISLAPVTLIVKKN